MAFPATSWYVNSVAYAAVAAWSNHTATAGEVIRQLTTPAVGNERCYVAVVGGATGSTEPTWTVTRGAKNTSSSATYQECTGQAGVNGDITNTPAWLSVKNTVVTLGAIIKDAAGTHLFIASTAGTAGNGSEPSWSLGSVGSTTADNTITWTYIGLASSFGKAAAPHARLANAFAATWSQSTEPIYIGNNSAETQSTAITLTGSSTIGSAIQQVLCHDHTGNYPPQSADLTTGSTITSSANVIQLNCNNLYMRGVGLTAQANVGSTILLGNTTGYQRLDNCPITLSGSAGASSVINIGSSAALRTGRLVMDNCTITFNNASQTINIFDMLWEWRNSTLAGTAPTNMLTYGSGSGDDVWIHGCDLSNAGSGSKLLNAAQGCGIVLFDRCKINNSVTITVSSLAANVQAVLSKCDAGAVNYRDELYSAVGSVTTETTIVRTGGQSDGVTPISRKVVTTGTTWLQPLEAQPIAVWNDTVGSAITITMFGIWGGGAVPNNDDFWIEVEYLGSTLTPISSKATSTKANPLASNAALSADASAWGGSTTAFKTSVTITPQMRGYIYVQPKMAKASSTLYYDEKLQVA